MKILEYVQLLKGNVFMQNTLCLAFLNVSDKLCYYEELFAI